MFKQQLLGAIDPGTFLACLFFAGLGVIFVLLLGTGLRDPQSAASPEPWSWKYLRTDNFKRIMASSIAVIITIRFMTELTGWELNVWKAFLVGTGWDGILLFLKQKTNWLDPKKP